MADAWRAVVGIAGLGVALAIRVVVAGSRGPSSVIAGVVFAALVLALAVALDEVPVRLRRADALFGLLGAALLCAPPLARHVANGTFVGSTEGYAVWAPAVVFVAVSEESLLRGSLFNVLQRSWGQSVAIVTTAVLFGFMHAPLYGLHVVPLDIAVGVWLGALRAATDSVTAPTVAHSIADLAGWWLR